MSMTRRQFLGAIPASGMAAALASCATTARVGTTAPPNILFILTDDQAPWTVGALGNAQAHTPHLDRLVREGVTCGNAFVTTPVCSPSRAGLLCGRYGTEVGITDWINPTSEPELGLDESHPSWVRALRDAGYRTGLVGKWHLGIQDHHHPSRFGYDYFAGFRSGGAEVENTELEIDGKAQPTEGLLVDRLTDLALEFLSTQDSRPFMLSLHHRSPHRPWLPAAEADAAPYRDKQLSLPDAQYPGMDLKEVDKWYREYMSSVSGVDRNVGRLLEYLDKNGLSENTVVIFTSDHGYNMGHHGIVHKGNGHWITKFTQEKRKLKEPVTRPNLFDTSLRVPLAVRWPGRLEAGRTVDNCVTNLDWFPTLLSMAGVDPASGPTTGGRDFLPLLTGDRISWEDSFYGQYSLHHTAQADLRMYRTPEWKLIRDFRNLGRDELYHLAKDPDERLNLLHDPIAWEQYQLLNTQLLRAMEEIGDPLFALASSV